MPISKLGQRRQVVLPKEICEELGLREGDYLEVTQNNRAVMLKPKKLVDPDDLLTPEEEAIVLKGEEQIRRGQSKSWRRIKHDLDL